MVVSLVVARIFGDGFGKVVQALEGVLFLKLLQAALIIFEGFGGNAEIAHGNSGAGPVILRRGDGMEVLRASSGWYEKG